MPLTAYGSPRHAWFFLGVCHRLAFSSNNTLSFSPKDKAVTSIRTKFMHARAFITATTRDVFQRYQALAGSTIIRYSKDDCKVVLEKAELFDEHYEALVSNPPDFDRLVREAHYFAATGSSTVVQFTNISLEPDQVAGLRDFFRLMAVIRQAIVETNIIVLRK